MNEENFLVKALNNIKSINIETVYNNFSLQVRESIKEIKGKLDKFDSLINIIFENEEKVNEFIKDQIIHQINKLYIIINEIKSISISSTAPDNDKIFKLQTLFSAKNEAPYFNISIFDYHYNKLVQLLSGLGIFNVNYELNKIYQEANSSSAEIQAILTNVKSASAELGVSKHSEEFKKIAEEYQSTAKKWLYITISFGIIIIIYLIVLFCKYSADAEFNLNLIFLKVAFFSTIFTAIIWSGNKYKILCHLYTVYLHKAKSLQTFRTFVDATDKEDKEIRNAVLLECTKTIFVTPETGYIKSEEKNSGTNIIEIMKNFKSSG